MHLVLARPEGASPGTKGLSLFLVPKFHFDPRRASWASATACRHQRRAQDGPQGVRHVRAHVRQHGVPAVGYLLGEVHDGIAQMFQVIEYARMMVGTKAIGTASDRLPQRAGVRQGAGAGRRPPQMPDKSAPRVTITHHPDVRRSLMLQKAYAEGLRAVSTYTATWQDRSRLGDDTGTAERVNDLLLPIVKGVGSERASEQLVQSLQTLGGSGYLQDYPIEQYVRDAKIDSLYEGTTAIQSLDFLFRKIVRDNGAALGVVAGEIQEFLTSEAGNGRLKEERALLGTALADVQGMLAALTGHLMKMELHVVGQHTVRLLMAVGDLLVGWLLLRQAEVALAALGGETGRDQPFYEGKVAVARFFAATQLPLLTAHRTIVEHADNSLMDVPEAAF